MRTFFDAETDKKLLEAKNKDEVMAIIAGTSEAEKLADKADLIMAEIERIRGNVDQEVDSEELDSVAGGSKLKDIYLSETEHCVATFYYEDLDNNKFCWSNDQCAVSNDYAYHNIRWSNCKKGGLHNWESGEYTFYTIAGAATHDPGYKCSKCGVKVSQSESSF